MSDTAYPVFEHYGTNAARLAFTPAPASGTQPIYVWYETDTNLVYIYTTAWKGPYAYLPSGYTTGDLLLGSGSNAVSRLAIGANTYVLTSNGTTAAWAAATGGSSYPTPTTMVASGSTELDFTSVITGSYRDYEIRLSNVTVSGTSVSFGLQFSTNGGSTYDTGSNYGMGRYYVGAWSGDTTGNNPNTTGTMIRPSLNAADTYSTGAHLNGIITLYNPGGTQQLKEMTVSIVGFVNNASKSDAVIGAAVYNNATAVNAFRFITTGTFSGTIICQPLPQ